MGERVLQSEQSSPRVPENGDRLEPERLPHQIEVADLTRHGDVDGLSPGERPTTATLVVVDDSERISEAIHLGQQILVTEVRSTVHDDDRESGTHITDVQPVGTSSLEAFACAGPTRVWWHTRILPRRVRSAAP